MATKALLERITSDPRVLGGAARAARHAPERRLHPTPAGKQRDSRGNPLGVREADARRHSGVPAVCGRDARIMYGV